MGAIPLTEVSVINQVVNYAEKLSYRDILNINSYGSNLNAKKLASFSKKSDIVIAQTNKQVTSQFKNKSTPSLSYTQNVISVSTAKVNDMKDSFIVEYDASISTYSYNMILEFSSSVSDFTDNIISQMSAPSSATIANIQAAASNAISSLSTKLTNSATAIGQAFAANITNLYNQKLNQIAAMIDVFNNMLNSTLTAFDSGLVALNKAKNTVHDFYKRAVGEASTSKYIQANVPDVTGAIKSNASILKNTPDAKIILPQLKSDVNKVKTFAANPLALLLGFVGSLIPSTSNKKIAEPKPTGDKAEYGKIQVKEMQGGSVKIQDQTPGNVRDIDLHPSGSYTAKIPNVDNPNLGDVNTKTTGDKQDITDGNWNITTSKDKVEIVVGENKIEIRKNDIQNILGNRDINITGNSNTVVGQDVVNDFKSNFTGKIAGNYTESVGGNRVEKTSGNLTEDIKGNHKETITGGLTISVVGNINIITHGIANISSKSAVNITSGGLVKIKGSKVLIG